MVPGCWPSWESRWLLCSNLSLESFALPSFLVSPSLTFLSTQSGPSVPTGGLQSVTGTWVIAINRWIQVLAICCRAPFRKRVWAWPTYPLRCPHFSDLHPLLERLLYLPGIPEDQDIFSRLSWCWLRPVAPGTPTDSWNEGQSWVNFLLNSPKKPCLSECFPSVLQRQCSEDMLIKEKLGSLVFLFSIWKEGLNMPDEPESICLEICPRFLLCWIAESVPSRYWGLGPNTPSSHSMISALWGPSMNSSGKYLRKVMDLKMLLVH